MEWFKVKNEDGKIRIFDPVRKIYCALTPEEKVRQTVLHHLIEDRKYPSGLVAVEYSIKVNGLNKRCDIVVFNRCGEPFMIVECKAESVAIDEKVLHQIIRYYSGLRCEYFLLTNLKTTLCVKIDDGRLVPQYDIPEYL